MKRMRNIDADSSKSPSAVLYAIHEGIFIVKYPQAAAYISILCYLAL